MRTSLFVFFLTTLWIAVDGCAGGEETVSIEKVETTDEYGNLEVYYRRTSNYAKEGLFTRLSAQGNKMEEAVYQNDTLNGPRILFYENGDTQSVEYLSMGVFSGPYRQYYPSGQLEQEGLYVQNEMTGPWKKYYEDGQLEEIVHFEGNEENGPFVEYHPNGQLRAEGQYRNGAFEQGELKVYNEAGELIRIMDCEQGVCHTRWTAEG